MVLKFRESWLSWQWQPPTGEGLRVRMEIQMKYINTLTIALLLGSLLALSACNTIQGVGEDIKQGGQALDRAVK